MKRKLPTTQRGILQLLIDIAENGNPYPLTNKTNEQDEYNIGALIAGIQNELGEMNETTLQKLNLTYQA